MDGFSRRSVAHRVWPIVTLAVVAAILGSESLGARSASQSVRVSTTPDAHAYALVQGNHWMSTNTSLAELQRLRKLYSGDFLWFRQGARSYLVRDEALLKQAKSFFAPLRSLDPERADLERRERALDRKEDSLEREEQELDDLADRWDDEDGEEHKKMSESDRRDRERRQRELESRRGELEEEQRAVEAIERSLDAKEDALEKKAEAELWKLIDHALTNGLARPN